jgi:hypothetical protein
MKKLLFGMALGAALSYLFDPQLGARRREQVRQRFDKSANSAGVAVDGPAIDIVMFEERTPAGVS